MTKQYYLIGVYGYKKCTPIQLSPYEKLADAERAKRWQEIGYLPPGEGYHVCTVYEADQPGVFSSVATGALFETSHMGWTEEAYNGFIKRTWPSCDN